MSHFRLFFFSGTGNTAFVAERLAKSLRARGSVAETVPVEELTLGRAALADLGEIRVVLGFPVHAFNAPEIMERFAALLPEGRGRTVSAFKTCGDPLLGGGSWKPFREALARRGWALSYERVFVMPANIALRYGKELHGALVAKAAALAGTMAGELLEGAERREPDGAFRKFFSWLGLFEREGAKWFGRTLSADKNLCVGCGKCAQKCPAGNVVMEGGLPKFGRHCAFCLRCVYGCPKNAIRSRIAQWAMKYGYRADAVPERKTVWIPRRFRKYLES